MWTLIKNPQTMSENKSQRPIYGYIYLIYKIQLLSNLIALDLSIFFIKIWQKITRIPYSMFNGITTNAVT